MRAKQTKYFMQQDTGKYKLYIYDNITAKGEFNWNTWEYDESETSAKHFFNLLQEIPEDAEMEIHINSYGGEVKEGVAIYNILLQHKAKKVGYVDGFACSAATLPLMACDKIIMGLGTYMLIHNMWMEAVGNAKELRKAADELDTLMKGNRRIYLERMNCSEEELIALMDEERYLTADECVEYGLCDEINKKEVAAEESSNLQELLQQMKKVSENNTFLNQEVEKMIKMLCEKSHEKSPEKPQENKNLERAAAFFKALRN